MQEDNNSQSPSPKRPPELYHSVLVELGLIPPSNTSKNVSQNTATDSGDESVASSLSSSHNNNPSLALLNYLLQTQQVSPATLKSAHSHLFRSSSSVSKEDPVPDTAAEGEEKSNDHPAGGDNRAVPTSFKSKTSNLSSTTPRTTTSASSSPSHANDNDAGAATGAAPHSSLHFQRHIALHLYYDGAQYSGLAETIGRNTDRSIEKEVFAALRKACLLLDDSSTTSSASSSSSISRELCQYSRCGRTDRGVSAAGQVLALKLKSAFRSDMKLVTTTSSSGGGEHVVPVATTTDLTYDDLPPNGSVSLTVQCPARLGKKKKNQRPSGNEGTDPATAASSTTMTIRTMTEIPYDKILNNLLPEDIRVLGWSPVSQEFSARFSAASRTYRYFFVLRPTLNLEAIRHALSRLVGTHDYRNFCKMDVEQVYNFRRTIHRADLIVPTPHSDYGYFEIHGQAFLWHQIRCIASVLFLVGHGLESPTVVTELLNVTQYPGKPSYPLAPEWPLVLHDCAYEHLRMGYSSQNLWSVSCLLEQQCDNAVLAAARIRNCLERVRETAHVRGSDLTQFVHGKWQLRKKKRQRRITSSPQTPSGETEESLTHPFEDAEVVPWSTALEWMETLQLVPEPMAGVHDAAYIPILQRSKGPTYEEKVANLQQSAKRRQRYETNVIKKRKTPEEDEAFYERMTRQGGSV